MTTKLITANPGQTNTAVPQDSTGAQLKDVFQTPFNAVILNQTDIAELKTTFASHLPTVAHQDNTGVMLLNNVLTTEDHAVITDPTKFVLGTTGLNATHSPNIVAHHPLHGATTHTNSSQPQIQSTTQTEDAENTVVMKLLDSSGAQFSEIAEQETNAVKQSTNHIADT